MATSSHRAARLALAALLTLSPLRGASAHEGPPFAIVMDHEIGSWSLSIWADPDIGTGTFYLLLDPPEEDQEAERPVAEASVFVRPAEEGAEETRYETQLGSRSSGYRFDGKVEFPVGGFYQVRFVLEGPAGHEELVQTVEATPPGFGKIDLLWYFAPFAAVGFLWFRAMVAKRRIAAEQRAS